jgi:hypothetical protein
MHIVVVLVLYGPLAGFLEVSSSRAGALVERRLLQDVDQAVNRRQRLLLGASCVDLKEAGKTPDRDPAQWP